MKNKKIRLQVALGIGCLGLVLPSCSTAGREVPIPETGASLTGTVTFRKEPVRIGMIIVAGTTGATGDIGEDGRYTVSSVPLGEVTIAINMAAARGQLMGMAATAKAKGDKKALPKIPDIPGKYSDPGSSPLKTTIVKGENTFNIVIE